MYSPFPNESLEPDALRDPVAGPDRHERYRASQKQRYQAINLALDGKTEAALLQVHEISGANDHEALIYPSETTVRVDAAIDVAAITASPTAFGRARAELRGLLDQAHQPNPDVIPEITGFLTACLLHSRRDSIREHGRWAVAELARHCDPEFFRAHLKVARESAERLILGKATNESGRIGIL